MKKINLLVILILFCVVLVSCNQQNNEKITAEEGNTQNTHNNDSQANNNSTDTPPISIYFNSFAELNEFLVAANGTSKEYEQFAEEFAKKDPVNYFVDSLTQKSAQNIASKMESISIPIANEKDYKNIVLSYTYSSDIFHITYNINDVIYRFRYLFGQEIPEDAKDRTILVEEKLDEKDIELYQGDKCFVGYIDNDFAVMQIVVDTESTNNVSFDIFKWGALGDN